MLCRGFLGPRTGCQLQKRLPESKFTGKYPSSKSGNPIRLGGSQRSGLCSWERRERHVVVFGYPEPETEKERSPLDYPQEWITPQPSRRPDIFPEFEKLDTPLPKPLPGDPEQPDEEEEVEKEKREPSPDPEEEEEEEETEEDEPKEPQPEE